MQRELQPGVFVPLVIFNSLGWSRREVFNLTVFRPDVSVVDVDGKQTNINKRKQTNNRNK
jgi:hypothetical protein